MRINGSRFALSTFLFVIVNAFSFSESFTFNDQHLNKHVIYNIELPDNCQIESSLSADVAAVVDDNNCYFRVSSLHVVLENVEYDEKTKKECDNAFIQILKKSYKTFDLIIQDIQIKEVSINSTLWRKISFSAVNKEDKQKAFEQSSYYTINDSVFYGINGTAAPYFSSKHKSILRKVVKSFYIPD